MISGLPEIDVDDWKSNTEYHNYSASSSQIQWFWRAIRSFDKEERAKLLQFVTGTSKVPLNGFKELEGMNGFSRFNIHRDYGSKDRLPSSHTCFNRKISSIKSHLCRTRLTRNRARPSRVRELRGAPPTGAYSHHSRKSVFWFRMSGTRISFLITPFTTSCMHGPGFDQHFWASASSVQFFEIFLFSTCIWHGMILLISECVPLEMEDHFLQTDHIFYFRNKPLVAPRRSAGRCG